MMCIVTVRTCLGSDYLDITVICDVTAERSNVLDEMRAAELCQAHRVHTQLAAGLARWRDGDHVRAGRTVEARPSSMLRAVLSGARGRLHIDNRSACEQRREQNKWHCGHVSGHVVPPMRRRCRPPVVQDSCPNASLTE